MIKILRTILLFACLISNLHAQPADVVDPLNKKLQQSLSSLTQKNNIKGAVILLYANGKLYEEYYGYADDNKDNPVIRKTIFEIGSISKIMTSLLFAQEYDWAKMALNDPVTKYVKGLPRAYDKITMQDLATGRYSNAGMDLLGEALAASTESDYGDLYRRHIMNPLLMVNGATVPKSLAKYYAQGYDRAGKAVSPVGEGFYASSYGIKASVADMQKFLSAAIGLPGTPPRVFYPMRLTQSMFIKKNDEFQGLAWQIHPIRNNKDINRLLTIADHPNKSPVIIQEILQRPVYSDNVMMDKTGMTDGFSAYIAVIPAKKSGIVILANKNIPDHVTVKLAREILLGVTNLS